ncbi:MAG: winged helix-turn-helix transcriptional regulator [Chloroflexi bacterium]|nr:winged helix-turn-helix transcriptional regulator [Chloroflexota bacterium]
MTKNDRSSASRRRRTHGWTFLTSHAVVFLHVTGHPSDTIQEISEHLGLATRTVAGVLTDLRREGYVRATRKGRQNVYDINPEMPMRHPSQMDHKVADFFSLFNKDTRRPG